VPSKLVPYFKPGKELKDLINATEPAELPAADPRPAEDTPPQA